MVSPCKKKKVDKKGRAPNEPTSPKNYSGSRRIKSLKPLSNKKFYLDIKNNSTLKQVEAKLTSLGARLEVFLVKDVSYVVTDRDDYHPRHPSKQLGLVTPSPFSVSVSPATTATDSPTDGVISKRTRSRAEAMLEKARLQPQRNTTIDSLDNATAWRIPIFTIPRLHLWLSELEKKRTSEPGVRELRGHYLKVETGSGRPDFRLLKTWPKLCYSEDEPAAFPPPKPLSRHDPQRMTRKVNKTGNSTAPPGGGNGYCEICRIHYDQLDTHLSSNQHIKLVSDPVQYSQLDSLISQHDLGSVSSLRKSLRIAKSPPVEMGTKHSMEAATHTPMNGHVTRSKTDKILSNGLSPNEKRKERKDSKSGGSYDNIKPEKTDALKEKEKEREREREREKEKEQRKEKEREREREKAKEKEKEREKEREKAKEKEKEREKEREKAKEKEKEREKEREKAKEKEKEREKEKVREKEKEREKEKVREKEKEKEKVREKEREREKEKERLREKEREREKEKAREKEREREKEKMREKEREKEKIREKEREREKEKMREREKEKMREKEREREKERAREKEREREKERAREKEKNLREKVKEREREMERIKEMERSRNREVDRGRDREKASSEEERSESDHNLRSRHSSKVPTPQSKRARPSRKRLSVEEKLIEDNRSYYKVEVLNSKLRSTELYLTQQQAEAARVNGGPEENGCEEKEDAKEPVVVRFRKVRKTQLAVLSDEAENFMFGDLTRREAKAAYSESSDDSRGDSDSSEEEQIPRKKKKRKSYYSEKHDRERRSLSPKSKNFHGLLTSQSCGEDENSDDEPLMTLSDISFSFENPPKNEPWMDNYQPEGKPYYFPHYHEYPTTLLPYEYPPAERMKLLSGKRGMVGGFRKRGERFSRLLEDGKPRKSPRCHASTLAIMSSLMRRRPMRECTTNPDFTYEEESRSSLPETVDTSSSASDARLFLPPDAGPPLPVEPSGDAYAIALARLACGETTSFQVTPGPCLPVDPAILSDPPPGIECPSGLSVPLVDLVDQTSQPVYRLLDFDLRFVDIDSGSDCSDLLGFGEDGRGVSGRRRKRKRNLTGWPVGKPRKRVIRKEEEATVIKCEPCEIKLEPLDQEVMDQLSFRDVPVFGNDSLTLPVIPIKRGRGRPRKYPLIIPPTSFSSPPLSPKTSPKKKTVPRFTFSPRRSCLK